MRNSSVLQDSFARKGVNIEAALNPDDELDYIYVVDRLLVRGPRRHIDRLQAAMPEFATRRTDEQPEIGGLVRLSIDQVSTDDGEPGSLTVPEVLDLIDERGWRITSDQRARSLRHPGPHRAHLEDHPGWGTGGAERVSDSAVAGATPYRREWRENRHFGHGRAAEPQPVIRG